MVISAKFFLSLSMYKPFISFLIQASDRPQPTTPNGISPRKIHKKFGKFCPPPPSSLSPSVKNFNTKQDIATTTMLNGLSENETPAKTFSQQQSAPSTPGKCFIFFLLSNAVDGQVNVNG